MMCDDGNRSGGDGCDENCLVEKNYVCRGGKQGSRDTCFYQYAEFMTANMTWTNSILVGLNRPVITVNGESKLTSEDLSVRVINRDGENKDIKWNAFVFR